MKLLEEFISFARVLEFSIAKVLWSLILVKLKTVKDKRIKRESY